MQFADDNRENDGLWMSLNTAVLPAIADGHRACHLALGAHAVHHGHGAAGSAVCAHSRRARQSGQGRLNGEEAKGKSRNELGDFSHA
jgi:hypothetical protein